MSGRSGGPIHLPDVSTRRSIVAASLASVIVVSTGPVTWHDDVGTAIPAGPCRDCADVTPAQPPGGIARGPATSFAPLCAPPHLRHQSAGSLVDEPGEGTAGEPIVPGDIGE